MDKEIYRKLKVPQCSRCEGDVEFYCKTCKEDLCVLCKEKHMIDLDTKYHDLVIDRLKYDDSMIQEYCERHRDRFIEYWCMSCEFPVCAECSKHRQHEILEIGLVYMMFRRKMRKRIVQIRTDIIHHNQVILASIKFDLNTGVQSKLAYLQERITERTKQLKVLIDLVMNDLSELKLSLKSRFHEPRRNITTTEMFTYKLEQLLEKPVQFLLCVKNNPIPGVRDFPDAFKFSLKSEKNIGNIVKLLGHIPIVEINLKGKSNEQLLELMSTRV